MHARQPGGGDIAGSPSTVNSAPAVSSTSAVSSTPAPTAALTGGQVRSAVLPEGKIVLGPDEIGRALTRVAHEILERLSLSQCPDLGNEDTAALGNLGV